MNQKLGVNLQGVNAGYSTKIKMQIMIENYPHSCFYRHTPAVEKLETHIQCARDYSRTLRLAPSVVSQEAV